MGQNDSLRVGYGRSVVFLNAQTAGTPASLYNYNSYLNIPALDTKGQFSPGCGSGTNNSRHTPVVISGQKVGNSNLFYCSNYAQSLLWLYDQNFDAPDVGAAQNSDYSNYDLTYQHQFHNGWGCASRRSLQARDGTAVVRAAEREDRPDGPGPDPVGSLHGQQPRHQPHNGRRVRSDDTGPAHRLERLPLDDLPERARQHAAADRRRRQPAVERFRFARARRRCTAPVT